MALPTVGDYTNVGMLALVGIGNVVTWIMVATKSATDRAASSATETAAIDNLTKEFSRMAGAWEGLSGEFQKHLREDIDYHARSDEIMKQLAEAQSTMARTIENQQRQITSLALGLAPEGEARAVPPNRVRR